MRDEEIMNKLSYILPRIQRDYGCNGIEFVMKSMAVNEEEDENETLNKGYYNKNLM